jgi:hypothetical protein
LVWRYPLDERRHVELRAALRMRDEQLSVPHQADNPEPDARLQPGFTVSQTPA